MNKNDTEHKFASMEDFLIDFCDERSKSRSFPYDLRLREYFQKHPLTKEDYERIKALLKECCQDFDAICEQYDIETEKNSRDEYAVKNASSKLFNPTNDSSILAIDDYGEVKIFFDTKKYSVDIETMQSVLNSLVCNQHCSGYDIKRILYGDIWVHFNPTYHEEYNHRHVIEKVVEELRRVAIDIEEDDSDFEDF